MKIKIFNENFEFNYFLMFLKFLLNSNENKKENFKKFINFNNHKMKTCLFILLYFLLYYENNNYLLFLMNYFYKQNNFDYFYFIFFNIFLIMKLSKKYNEKSYENIYNNLLFFKKFLFEKINNNDRNKFDIEHFKIISKYIYICIINNFKIFYENFEDNIQTMNDFFKVYQKLSILIEKINNFLITIDSKFYSQLDYINIVILNNFLLKIFELKNIKYFILINKNKQIFDISYKDNILKNFFILFLTKKIIINCYGQENINTKLNGSYLCITEILKIIINIENKKLDAISKSKNISNENYFNILKFLEAELIDIEINEKEMNYIKHNENLYYKIKIIFILNLNILNEYLKFKLLLNSEKYDEKIIKIIRYYIFLFEENENEKLKKKYEIFYYFFISIYLLYFKLNNNIDLNIYLSKINFEYIYNFYIECKKKSNIFPYTINKIIIIKIFILLFSKYKYKTKYFKNNILENEFNKDLSMMNTLKINNEKFDFYMQIINIYFLYYNIKDEINKNKDYNNIMINLNKIKKFLNNLILILQTLIKNNSNFSKNDNSNLLYILSNFFYYIDSNFTENKYNYDIYIIIFNILEIQNIIIDIIYFIIVLSKYYINNCIKFGFCENILKLIKQYNKIPILKYNNKFFLYIIKTLIHITRKWKRKQLFLIFKDSLDFKNLKEFDEFEFKIFNIYFRNKYKLDIKFENLNEIKEYIINNNIEDYILNKNLNINSILDIKNSNIKILSNYIKNELLYNKNINIIQNEFYKFFNISSKNCGGIYFIKCLDLDYKYQIKLIPYIYPDEFNDYFFENKNSFNNLYKKIKQSYKENQLNYNSFKNLKHIKKIIKTLIYISSFLENNYYIIKLIKFYIKYIHNFKLNLNKNFETGKKFKEKNYISLFRIKFYLFLFIKYKEHYAYNKINLNKNYNETIFKNICEILEKEENVPKEKFNSSILNKFDYELRNEFFKLQNILLLDNNNIIKILKIYFNDNKNLIEYINNKLIKYNLKSENIDNVLNNFLKPINQEELNYINDKNNLFYNKAKTSKQKIKKFKNIFENSEIKNFYFDEEYVKKCVLKLKYRFLFSSTFKINLYNDSNSVFYYIPSTELSKIPLENLPILFNVPILRTNSYKYILNSKIINNFNLNIKEIFYLVNPKGDLVNTEKRAKILFNKYNIEGIKNVESNKEFENNLKDKKIFIYCGHGDATKYFSLDYIKWNKINFLTFLFGCSSLNVQLILDKDTQPFGLPNYYLYSECPFILGFLWNVTSKDIDDFMINIFDNLFKQNDINNETLLIKYIMKYKKSFKRKFINGCSLVIYANQDILLNIKL